VGEHPLNITYYERDDKFVAECVAYRGALVPCEVVADVLGDLELEL
jgi:hypothetical protein